MLRILLWCSALAALLWLAATVRPTAAVRAVLPQGDGAFARELDFLTSRDSSRTLAIEAEVADAGALPAARARLLALPGLLAAHGATPAHVDDPAAAARALAVVETHLPLLLPPEALDALDLSDAALTTRLGALLEQVRRPEHAGGAARAQRDPLDLAGTALAALAARGGTTTDGPLLRHADGRHLLLVLRVGFDPALLPQSRALLAAAEAACAPRADGVRLRIVGAYRHYRDNLDAVRRDLFASLPPGLVLIALIRATLLPLRALPAVYAPALLGVVGALAAARVADLCGLGPMPLPLFGFAAAILGIAVDYGTHVALAARHGQTVRLPLALSFATTAVAFALLMTSTVPGLRLTGAMVVGGLFTALCGALWLTPRLLPTLTPGDPWARVSVPLDRGSRGRLWPRLVLAAALTAAAIPGALRLAPETDLRRFDASDPQAWADLDAVSQRWGAVEDAAFLVADADAADAALARLAATRAALGLAPGLAERLVPTRAEQERRLTAWNAYWDARQAAFAAALGSACTRVGLRPAAFAAAQRTYAARTPTWLTPATWTGTPFAAPLAELIAPQGDGWRAVQPAPAAVLATFAGSESVWAAGRAHLGDALVATLRSDLTGRAALIALAMVATVLLATRALRPALGMLLPPALALLWTFGALGWSGVPLSPFALLAAAFVGGIGIDSAIFLVERRGAAVLTPITAATLTTVVGVGALCLAGHPLLRGIGLTLAVGMAACLGACLLLCRPLAGPNRPDADATGPTRP